MTLDPDTFRSVLGRFASGITVVTTRDADGRDAGLTVSAFSSVSLHPPLIQVCVDQSASVYPVIAARFLRAFCETFVSFCGEACWISTQCWTEQDSRPTEC